MLKKIVQLGSRGQQSIQIKVETMCS